MRLRHFLAALNTVLGLRRTIPGAIISIRNNRIMGNKVDGKITKSLPQR